MVYSPKASLLSSAAAPQPPPPLRPKPKPKAGLSRSALGRLAARASRHLSASAPGRSRLTRLLGAVALLALVLGLQCFLRPRLASLSVTFLRPAGQPTIELDPFPHPRPTPFIHPGRYLSYLPHSGYHNQRIALENALTLARVLNRTLLLPPCFLGSPVPFIRSDKLAHRLATASSKAGLEHCRTPSALQPRECLAASIHTTLGWDQLIDLRPLAELVSLLDLPSGAYTPATQAAALHLDPVRDVYSISDERVYDHRYSLAVHPSENDRLGKFDHWVDVPHQLAAVRQPLIALGSLFGSARLHDPSRNARTPFREAMVPHSPILDARATEIVEALGGPDTYWAAHLRLGDSVFRAEGEARARAALEKLVTGPMGLPLASLARALNRVQLTNQPNPGCRGALHKPGSDLVKFNRKLYIATDAPVPQSEPALVPFFAAFPCAVVLDDYGLGLNLSGLRNGADGVGLGGLFAPLLDAVVAGRAKGVVGTEGSTFSRFVVDVLFPTYHRLPIIQHG